MANEPATREHRPADRMHSYMLDRAKLSSSFRGEDVMSGQAERILGAETEKEIWDADAGGVIQMRDVPGLEVEIRTYEPVVSNRDDIQGGHGYYISAEATVLGGPEEILTKNGLDVGMDITIQTGAPLAIAKLRAFEQKDLLPVQCVITAIPTASGNTVVKLRPLPKRTVKATTA